MIRSVSVFLLPDVCRSLETSLLADMNPTLHSWLHFHTFQHFNNMERKSYQIRLGVLDGGMREKWRNEDEEDEEVYLKAETMRERERKRDRERKRWRERAERES